MTSSVEWTRRHLKSSLNKDLTLYERYIPNPKVLAEYLEGTKRALLIVVGEIFDEKIQELRAQPVDKPVVPRSSKGSSFKETTTRCIRGATRMKSSKCTRV